MKRNYKVLHIITSLGSGGAEGMLYRLIKNTQNLVEHSVICLDNGGKYVSLLRSEGIDVLVVNINLFSFPVGFFKILKFSLSKRKKGFKVIMSWLYHADLVAWFVKLLCKFNGLAWNIRNSRLQRGRLSINNWLFLKILSKLSFLYVNTIVSCSTNAGEIHKNIGYRKDIFKTIPNGYFLDITKKFNKDDKYYDGNYRIALIARWHPKKDFENLFNALSLLKYKNINFNLTIAGKNTDPNNKKLLSHLVRYGIKDNCTLLGEVNDLQEIYKKSHVCVLPSSYGEAFPNVLVESMVNYTPCISTDVGDAGVIISGVGILVPIEDPKALMEALIEYRRILVYENDVYIKYCEKGFEKIKREYDIRIIAEKYFKVWQSLN